MTWFAFKGYNGGKAIDVAGSQEKQLVFFGFHGYGTEAQAEKLPNSVNLLTAPQVNLIIADASKAVSEGAQPGGPNDITTPGGLGAAVVSQAPGVSDLYNLARNLGNGATWERAGEVLAGMILLYVGLRAVATPASGSYASAPLRHSAGKAIRKAVR